MAAFMLFYVSVKNKSAPTIIPKYVQIFSMSGLKSATFIACEVSLSNSESKVTMEIFVKNSTYIYD